MLLVRIPDMSLIQDYPKRSVSYHRTASDMDSYIHRMHLDLLLRAGSQSQCGSVSHLRSQIDRHKSPCRTGDDGVSPLQVHRSNEHRQNYHGMSQLVRSLGCGSSTHRVATFSSPGCDAILCGSGSSVACATNSDAMIQRS